MISYRDNRKGINSFILNLFFKLYFRFAYIEFVDKESVENALKLDDSQFRGRQLKVHTTYILFTYTDIQKKPSLFEILLKQDTIFINRFLKYSNNYSFF